MSDDDQNDCSDCSDYIYFDSSSNRPVQSKPPSFLLSTSTKSTKTRSPLSPVSLLISAVRSWLVVFLVNHIALSSLGYGDILKYSLGLAAVTTVIELTGNTKLLSNCVAVFFWMAIPQLLIIAFRDIEVELIHLLIIVGGSGGIASIVTGLVCSNVW